VKRRRATAAFLVALLCFTALPVDVLAAETQADPPPGAHAESAEATPAEGSDEGVLAGPQPAAGVDQVQPIAQGPEPLQESESSTSPADATISPSRVPADKAVSADGLPPPDPTPEACQGTDLRQVGVNCNPDVPPATGSFGDLKVFPYGGRTDSGRHIDSGTLYASAYSRVHGLRMLGGYLTAEGLDVVSQSGADPDAAATQTWWWLTGLVLHASPDGPPLISWTGGIDTAEPDFDLILGNLNGEGSPDPDVELTITIHLPGGGSERRMLSCPAVPLLCDPGAAPGIPLLDSTLYEGTELEGAFNAIGDALRNLTGSGRLEGLQLITGPSSRNTDGVDFAESSISGLHASFLDSGKPVQIDVGVASSRADSTELTASIRATDFQVTPSNCSGIEAPGCAEVVTSSSQLSPPQRRPPGISGVAQGVRNPGGGGGGDGGPTEGATPQQSVQAVAQLLPSPPAGGAVTAGAGAADIGGGNGGVPSPNGENGPNELPPASLPSPGTVASESNTILPWIAAVAGLALFAGGLLGWRRARQPSG
jgi:hypothetical protein